MHVNILPAYEFEIQIFLSITEMSLSDNLLTSHETPISFNDGNYEKKERTRFAFTMQIL